MKEQVHGNFEENNEELQNEVYKIGEKLRGYKPEECYFLINDYLKETVQAADFKENDPAFSSAYAALVCKKANSYGFSQAFLLILNELGISATNLKNSSVELREFRYNGEVYSFLCVNLLVNSLTMRYSPFTEKLCNRWMIEHDTWFSTMTWLH